MWMFLTRMDIIWHPFFLNSHCVWGEREHNRLELMHELFMPLILNCLYMKLFRNKVTQVHRILIFRGFGIIPCILLGRENQGRT